MLIAPATAEGVPREDLSKLERNVWAALSESEGHLCSVNTYDSAFLSVGPLQQTAGARNFRGELFGAMATVREEAPEVFEEYIGRHGLTIHEPRMELAARKAYAKIGDEVLDDADSKERLRAFTWAYRVATAFDDPDFRAPMLQEGFRRIATLQDLDVTLTVTANGTETDVETTVGELFRRDLAMALLVDAHVNAPAIVWPGSDANVWEDPFSRKLSDWDITNVEDLERRQERTLVTEFLVARLGEGDPLMTNPAGRAVKVLKYAENSVVQEIVASAGYRGRNAVPNFLRLELDIQDSSRESRRILDHERKPIDFSTPNDRH